MHPRCGGLRPSATTLQGIPMMHPTRSLLPFVLAALAATAPSQIPECTGETTTTASGLQYCVLQKGRDEPSPQANDTVEVHYTGWLTNGKEFDSSRKRGEPLKFALNSVIKGWSEGVQLMTPGARFKFTIPPELGYGTQEAGAIPPNSTLVFDVELLRVIAMPRFVPANKENQRDLPSGGKWEAIKVGTGPAPEDSDAVAFGYAIFEP